MCPARIGNIILIQELAFFETVTIFHLLETVGSTDFVRKDPCLVHGKSLNFSVLKSRSDFILYFSIEKLRKRFGIVLVGESWWKTKSSVEELVQTLTSLKDQVCFNVQSEGEF